MRTAFVGKGGSGKTTLSALFARHLARSDAPVVAIDADINQHLGVALGLEEDALREVVPLSTRLGGIKEYLRGDNPRIASADAMVKTTPPGRGSRLLRPLGPDPVHTRHVRDIAGVRLMTTGVFTEEDLGVACYHSKLGAVELYLNHLVDGPGEYVVVDMTAGADSFASGLFTRFDMTFLVAEPTRKGVSVYRQYKDHAAEFGVPLAVVGNKVTGEDDRLFLKEHVGDDLLVCFGHSDWVRAREQGRHTGELEPEHRLALEELRIAVDSRAKDWETFQRQAVEFHLRNARAWADRATGQDLSTQVDPDFQHGPAALSEALIDASTASS
ncbi:ATP-binding protein [Streptomyces rugosispiralis]|uniref:ATP-binding protein n=2 Tax=Streptomyces TaxID=1883 RepID=A0ABT1VEH2_9ACTN|nr:ATP-binding protein [Streptomyces rugosispiralis]MCQ8195209.1 ATP-binding protein [Streptomyces rugosispiralis]